MLSVGSKGIKDSLRHKDPKGRKKERQIILYLIVFFIKLYQYLFSPILGRNCRFTPTCSNYSISAIRKYGLKKGFILSIKRISRCHPWNKGGYDPVP